MRRASNWRAAWACAVLVLTVTGHSESIAQKTGEAIYQQQCVECHGDRGQGVDGKYDDALTGNLSVEALTRKIDRTMPEDREGDCVGEDARLVAEYIYKSFYSAEAYAKLHPPRRELARLTTPQFRNSVMDVVTTLLPPVPPKAGQQPGKPPQRVLPKPLVLVPGLKARYRGLAVLTPEQIAEEAKAQTDPKKKQNRKRRPNANFERVDAQVAFHFGAESPDPKVLLPQEFTTSWDGSFYAKDTGVYEFIIKTENGVRLWVNDADEDRPLIDAWVSAGPQVREEAKSLYLLGGRSYRLSLSHFKFKEATASVELWWKPPHGVRELMPAEVFITERAPCRMIVSTSFPADDRSAGYERGTTISPGWDQAVTQAAIAASEYVELHTPELARLGKNEIDPTAKIKALATQIVESAFRRPLTPEEQRTHVDELFQSAKSPTQAVKRATLLALKSPQFLYPDLGGMDASAPQRVAAHLALALWDSVPDTPLLQAAELGLLNTPDGIKAEARRMLTDERCREKMRGFFHHWLELEKAETAAKDQKAFPGFDAQVLADLRESLLRFTKDVLWSPTSDYRELLQADYLLLNARLAKVYGKTASGETFQKVSFDPKQRTGVVTHPYLLSALAYSRQTSPIHRGVFLTRNIVGMSLKPPQMAVSFDDSHFDPKLTMREKVTELTSKSACMSCHSVINPLGFSLENFDAIGRWRTKDNNKPVNPVSDFSDDQGKKIRLTGPRDIANYVAGNPSGHRAFIRQVFQHLTKQSPTVYGVGTLDALQKSFAAANCNIQHLMVEISALAATDDSVK